jgi:hypothetical protein
LVDITLNGAGPGHELKALVVGAYVLQDRLVAVHPPIMAQEPWRGKMFYTILVKTSSPSLVSSFD